MFDVKYSKPATSLLMILTIGTALIAPMVNITSASAQLFPTQRRSPSSPNNNNDYRSRIIPAGTVLPLEYEQEKILVTEDETVDITLTVAANIRDRNRNTLIPYGTLVVGIIEPAGNGSRFVAEELVFSDGTTQFINASSNIVTRRETVKRGTEAGDILKGAAIGAAAASIISAIFGDVDLPKVLGGAGLGALAGWLLGRESVELVSIDPNNDLDITLQSDLVLP
ncbi:MAG: hypothetical protein QNJ65_04985 [Xenococcaceae cyanobacterium MO_234.B1]|nr:hypothetical protein [Xenococcaceae cyanobacterium MO_234.B1]